MAKDEPEPPCPLASFSICDTIPPMNRSAKFIIHHSAFIIAFFLSACAPLLTPPPATDLHITIIADGKTIPLTTRAITVRDALNEAGVPLNVKDKLTPTEFTQLTDGLTPASVSNPPLGHFPFLGVPYSGFSNPS